MQWDDSVNCSPNTTVKIFVLQIVLKKILFKSVFGNLNFWSGMLSECCKQHLHEREFFVVGRRGGASHHNFFGPFFLNFLDLPLLSELFFSFSCSFATAVGLSYISERKKNIHFFFQIVCL